MTRESVQLTRQELYERVWETPMSKLGPEFGLSDVGLKKLCVRYRIPTPPLGHWAKLTHGKSAPVPAMEELDEQDLNTINLFRKQFEQSSEAAVELPRIGVDQKLIRPHRLVAQSRKKLRIATPDERKLLGVYGELTKCCHCQSRS